jgi:uncharacterized membrane protein YvbJ
MKFCSHCGTEVNLGAKFCSSCGQKIIENSSETFVEKGESFIIQPVFNPIVVIGRYFFFIFIASFQIGGVFAFFYVNPLKVQISV